MNSTLAKNILSLMSIQGVNYLLPLITLPYLVRTLGPEGYGVLGYMLAVMQYGCLITDYGFNLSATRQIAIIKDDRKQVSQIFWSVIFSKIILFLISLLVMAGLAVFEENIRKHFNVFLASMGLVLGNILFPSWLFQGKEKMGWVAISNIVARFSTVPLIFIFVHNENDIWIAALITGCSSIIAGLIGLFLVYKQRWIGFGFPELSKIIFQLKEGWHIFLSSAAINVYTTSTTVILGLIAGPVVVGYYVAADKLRLAVQGLIMPVAQALYPRINSLMQKDKNEAFKLIRRLLIMQGGGAFLLSISLFFGASVFIGWLYGDGFAKSIPVLHWLAWLPVIIGISNVYGYQTLLTLGMKKIFSRIVIIGSLISLLSIYPLVTKFQAEGAAISVILAELSVNLMMLYIILKKKYPVFCKPKKSNLM